MDAPEAADAVAAAFASLREMDRIFSTWRDDSEIMRLRRGELTIERVRPAGRRGARDRQRGGAGHRGRVHDAAARRRGRPRPRPHRPRQGLGGRARGRPARRPARVSACVNGAGDLAVVAHQDLPDEGPDAIAWRIGIEDPTDLTRTAEVVTLTRGAVATSGTAARGAHLYDPAGRRMVGRPGSTSVHGPSLLWADIWATALFVGGTAAREAFTSRAPAYTSIEL